MLFIYKESLNALTIIPSPAGSKSCSGRSGNSGAQVTKLQQNLNAIKAQNTVPNMTTISVNGVFGTSTVDNLKKVQSYYGLTADGVYGTSSRNLFMDLIGSSSEGYIRFPFGGGVGFKNRNDESYESVDYSWLTVDAMNTAMSFAVYASGVLHKDLLFNDGSYINGGDNTDHDTHTDGRDLDISTSNLTTDAELKTALEYIIAQSNVERVLFKETYVLPKVVKDAGHYDHFHVDFYK
ncbi:peptidoglycan-binding protein [Bacillus salitolerans]|uniref:Peptidoglycan-binding protein n=1 Tax=Bacillus salitolerans TaxID=1437434 RepID=A0ABW4LS57_9BACI